MPKSSSDQQNSVHQAAMLHKRNRTFFSTLALFHKSSSGKPSKWSTTPTVLFLLFNTMDPGRLNRMLIRPLFQITTSTNVSTITTSSWSNPQPCRSIKLSFQFFFCVLRTKFLMLSPHSIPPIRRSRWSSCCYFGCLQRNKIVQSIKVAVYVVRSGGIQN